MKNKILKLSAILITLFGLITIFMSGSVLFDLFGIRAMEGNFVLVIVFANFLCGFIYLIVAFGFVKESKFTTRLLFVTILILLLSLAFLFFHINSSGLYERKTVAAILFRIALTGLFAGISWYYITGNKNKSIKPRGNSYKLEGFLIIVFSFFSVNDVNAQTYSINQCIDTALLNNRNIKLYKQDVLLAKEKKNEAISNLLPKIIAIADFKYYTNLPYQLMPAKAFGGPAGTYKEVQFGLPQNLNANVQFNLPLFNTTILNSIQTTDLLIELSEIQKTKSEEDVVIEVSNAYYNAQILSNQLAFIDSNIINSSRLVQTTSLLHQQQLAKNSDVDRVKLQLAQLQTQKITVFTQYQQVLNALKFQMGKPLTDSLAIMKEYNEIIVFELPIQPTSNVKLIEKKLDMNYSELSGLKYSRLPTLGLYGTYGTTGYGSTGDNSFFNFYSIGFVGVQLSVPLFNGLTTHHKIEQKITEIDKNTIMKNLLSEKNSLDTKNAKMQYEVMKKSIETTATQIDLAKSIWVNTVLQNKQGVASITDLLLADNSIREAQQNYIVALINLRKAELEYKQVTGNLLNK